jgi:hypothetical protein
MASAPAATLPRTYRPAKWDRALWSLQVFILFFLVVGFIAGIVAGARGDSSPSLPTLVTLPNDFPPGLVLGIVCWAMLIGFYLFAGRAKVVSTATGIEVTPYAGGVRRFAWTEVRSFTVESIGPYVAPVRGAGTWVAIRLWLTNGRSMLLHASRRPKGRTTDVETMQEELSAALASQVGAPKVGFAATEAAAARRDHQ